jgi:protein-disulfide isomerase
VKVAPVLISIAIGLLLGICLTLERSLETDMETLKSGQEELQRDFAEVKGLLTQGRGENNPIAQALPSNPQVVPSNVRIKLDNALSRGDAKAPITLVEFTDFQCPFCRAFFMQTAPQLVTDYVKTGQVRYVVKDFPLESIHPNALKAAEAVHCADVRGKGWEMRARLFQNQDHLGPESLIAYAKAIGLSEAAFAKCLNSGQFTEVVRENISEGQAAGVNGTPTLFLGVVDPNTNIVTTQRSIVGAQPIAVFQKSLGEMLSAAK